MYFFSIFQKTGSLLPKDQIHANLSAIMDQSHTKAEHPLAVMTSEHRDTWASVRSHLVSNPKNAQLLDHLDSALFGVFLDDRECKNENDATEMFLYGEGDSRYSFEFWFVWCCSKDSIFDYCSLRVLDLLAD